MQNFSMQDQTNSDGSSPSPAPPAAEVEQLPVIEAPTLEVQLATVKAQLAESVEVGLRARADGENIRRHAIEDVQKAHKFAVISFAEAMIPVRDSLEMALLHDSPSAALMKEGIQITLKQMESAFTKHGLIEILPQRGDRFDPMKHQAVALVPSGSLKPNTVATVLQKGYMIADRLLRPAIVTAAQEKSDL